MNRSRESGMALLVVLWTLLLVGIVGASVSSQARKQGMLSRNGVLLAQAEAVAEAGVVRAVVGMLDLRPEAAWHADGSVHRFSLDQITVEVRIVDEAGKVDINAASPELIATLLQVCGASPDTAVSVAADVADLRRGAVTGRPKGFETTSELLAIPGMTPAIYDRAAPFMTVLTRATGIDPSVAAPELLAALANIDPSLAPTINAARAMGASAAAPALPTNGYLTQSQHTVFTIQAVARAAKARFGRQATIRLTHNAELPLLVHSWTRLIEPVETPAAQNSRRRSVNAFTLS